MSAEQTALIFDLCVFHLISGYAGERKSLKVRSEADTGNRKTELATTRLITGN